MNTIAEIYHKKSKSAKYSKMEKENIFKKTAVMATKKKREYAEN